MPNPIYRIARSATKRRCPRFVEVVACGYCHGSGTDLKFGSRCPVCGATGRINVTPPVLTCLRCGGFGRQNGDLTCLACRGTGVGQIRTEAAACAKCGETGEDGIFYCLPCQGQGLV
jgi:DnaJ-class molecular chaperone